ncbi:MAG: hypothetical protein KF678_12920 [Phycisphaeraceae bacterium]|nr:hypothetical protein [Phycisphaeraceae bacterium]
MELMGHLWLPILISAVAVWVASAVAWMVIGHHKGDMKALPDEAKFFDAIESLGIQKGNYGFPDCKTKEKMKSPEVQKRWEAGQAGMLTMFGRMSMGRNMVLSFLVYLVISFFVAYLGIAALPRGTGFSRAFQVLGTAGVLGYAFGHIPGMIWFAAFPRAIVMCLLDGIVYGLITGAVIAAMWP